MRGDKCARDSLWDEVKREEWELLAKEDASRYVGGVTRQWLKVKIRRQGRFVVVGLDVPLAGACSLLLAPHGMVRGSCMSGALSGARRARSSPGSASSA
jgi:hypothetical protein